MGVVITLTALSLPGYGAAHLAATMEPPVVTFDDPRLEWCNGSPPTISKNPNRVHGPGPRCGTSHEDGQLELYPIPQRDNWSRTFYKPLLVKSNGQSLVTTVPLDAEATLTLAFTLIPASQFDQAGAMIVVDEFTWVKAGIEWCDGEPKLSCVVTNDGFSDWSTQLWPHFDPVARTVSARVRVHRVLPGTDQGPALVFEAAPMSPGDTVDRTSAHAAAATSDGACEPALLPPLHQRCG